MKSVENETSLNECLTIYVSAQQMYSIGTRDSGRGFGHGRTCPSVVRLLFFISWVNDVVLLVYVLAGYIRGVLFFRVFGFSDAFASGSVFEPRGCLP